MMLRIITLILVLASICFSQQTGNAKDESLRKGEEIVRKAREAAGFSTATDSFQINSHYISTLKGQGRELTTDLQIEITVSSNQIRNLAVSQNGNSTTDIWNGKKFRRTAEMINYDGRRYVVDMTDGVRLGQNAVNAIKSKNPNAKIPVSSEAAARTAGFNSNLWTSVFPFILIHPIESAPKFEYIGRAQAGEQTAAVVETKTVIGEILRFFFDEKTNNLLMITKKRKYNNREFEAKYYYTNRERINGILVPTKIKSEEKEIPVGQSSISAYENSDLTDFQINPIVKPDIFKIN